jgi:Protein of unknown function (DUF4199)
MNPVLGTGVVIGVLCGVWMLITGFTGWYKDPAMRNLFFFVIAIEIAGLLWGLRRTAAEGRTYGGQIVAGTMMAVIAGVIIMVFSVVFTPVLFPSYFEDMQRTFQRTGATPVGEALQGFMGTLITGIVASAVIGLFFRSRRAAPNAAV